MVQAERGECPLTIRIGVIPAASEKLSSVKVREANIDNPDEGVHHRSRRRGHW